MTVIRKYVDPPLKIVHTVILKTEEPMEPVQKNNNIIMNLVHMVIKKMGINVINKSQFLNVKFLKKKDT